MSIDRIRVWVPVAHDKKFQFAKAFVLFLHSGTAALGPSKCLSRDILYHLNPLPTALLVSDLGSFAPCYILKSMECNVYAWALLRRIQIYYKLAKYVIVESRYTKLVVHCSDNLFSAIIY